MTAPDQIAAIFGELNQSNPLFILAVYSPGIVSAFLVWRHYGSKGLGSFFRRLTLWRTSRLWWFFLILGIPIIFFAGAALKGTISDPFPFSPWYQVLPAIGLALFLRGLDMALFPLGEALAASFARKGSLFWLLAFAFALGFGTTVAEPALIAVCSEASKAMAAAGVIVDETAARDSYALKLRYTVALSVGVALVLGVFRILKGWPVHLWIMAGYTLVVALTAVAPKEIIGIAYDSGGVTTSTITVPLVTALGVGLAAAIRGRNPMIDGFGLIAFASLSPIIFVLIFGML